MNKMTKRELIQENQIRHYIACAEYNRDLAIRDFEQGKPITWQKEYLAALPVMFRQTPNGVETSHGKIIKKRK